MAASLLQGDSDDTDLRDKITMGAWLSRTRGFEIFRLPAAGL